MFTKIVKNYQFNGEQAKKIIDNLLKINPNIAEQYKEIICINIDHYRNLPTLKEITPKLLDDIKESKNLCSVTKDLLSKTYFQMLDPKKREDFGAKWVDGLEKIIDSNFVLTSILSKASADEGDIYIADSSKVPGSKTAVGIAFYPDLAVAIKNHPIEYSLDTLVHESTHKVIQNKFSNNSLPFYGINNSENKELVNSFVVGAKKVEGDTWGDIWLKKTLNYPENKHAVEIFAWFAGEMTQSLLKGHKSTAGIPKIFAQQLWDYLCKEICDIPSIIKSIELVISELVPHAEGAYVLNDIILEYMDMGSYMDMPSYIHEQEVIGLVE